MPQTPRPAHVTTVTTRTTAVGSQPDVPHSKIVTVLYWRRQNNTVCCRNLREKRRALRAITCGAVFTLARASARSYGDPTSRRLLARVQGAALRTDPRLLILVKSLVERRQVIDDALEINLHAAHQALAFEAVPFKGVE